MKAVYTQCPVKIATDFTPDRLVKPWSKERNNTSTRLEQDKSQMHYLYMLEIAAIAETGKIVRK